MSESKFYSFNLNYYPQLKENWCWAACFKSILDSFEIKTDIGIEQTELVSYYRKNYPSDESCPPYAPDVGDDITICYNHLSSFLNELTGLEFNEIILKNTELSDSEFSLEEIVYNKLNYESVKSYLTERKFPIIFAMKGHIYLLSGYGLRDSCQYFLISNPDSKKNEMFKKVDNFFIERINDLERVWIIKEEFDNENKISPDLIMAKKIQLSNDINSIAKTRELNHSIFNDNMSLFYISGDINDILIDYNSRDVTLLKSIIQETILNPRYSNFCSIQIPKRKIKNIEFIYKIYADYFNTGELNIDINELKVYFDYNNLTVQLSDQNGTLFGEILEPIQNIPELKGQIQFDKIRNQILEINKN